MVPWYLPEIILIYVTVNLAKHCKEISKHYKYTKLVKRSSVDIQLPMSQYP